MKDMIITAKNFDAEGQPVEAAKAYESIIISGEADIDIYFSLVGLYFVCNDGGYAAAHKLSSEFLTNAWRRVGELLNEAGQRFGEHPEINFWRKYFNFIYLGEKFSVEECEAIISNEKTLVPYMYLFAFGRSADRKKYAHRARQLLEQVSGGLTERERYIRAVLQAAFQKSS